MESNSDEAEQQKLHEEFVEEKQVVHRFLGANAVLAPFSSHYHLQSRTLRTYG